MSYISCGDPNFRLQSVEERAEIRRKRRQREEGAARARGEHIPTTEEKVAAFVASMHRVQAAMRKWRVALERQRDQASRGSTSV